MNLDIYTTFPAAFARRLNNAIGAVVQRWRLCRIISRQSELSRALRVSPPIRIQTVTSCEDLRTDKRLTDLNRCILMDCLMQESNGSSQQKPKAFYIVQFGYEISSVAATAEIGRLGLRVGNCGALLSLSGPQVPNAHDLPLVALGSLSLVAGRRMVPILRYSESGCQPDSAPYIVNWDARCKFLASNCLSA